MQIFSRKSFSVTIGLALKRRLVKRVSRGANEGKISVSDSFYNYINDQIIFKIKFIVF